METQTKLSKLEKILDLAKKNGASETEVIQKSYTENPVNFENNKLKTLESNESSGIGIRLIKNKKIGLASTTDPDAIESTIISAIEASEYGPEATFEFSKEELNSSDVDSTVKNNFPLEELVKRGTKAIEQLKTFHKDTLISGGFDLGYGETIYLNSNGVSGKRNKTVYSSSFYVNLVRGEDFLGVYEGNSNLDNFPDEKEITKKILEKLNYSKENITLTTKTYPVIFTPHAVSSIFVDILIVLLNGKAIQQGISPLADKIGEKLFDGKLSLIEDPEIGTAKTPFDDEGIKTKKKTLIQKGVVNSFYFDLSSGSRVMPQHASTGNGFKGTLSTAPAPKLTSIKVESGKTSYNDLIKNIKEGVLIDQVLGAGQSNTLAGEYNVGIDLGFKIVNGEIKGRIKNCMIAGNIFEVLKNITEISHEQECVYGSSFLPWFLFDNLTVGAK